MYVRPVQVWPIELPCLRGCGPVFRGARVYIRGVRARLCVGKWPYGSQSAHAVLCAVVVRAGLWTAPAPVPRLPTQPEVSRLYA